MFLFNFNPALRTGLGYTVPPGLREKKYLIGCRIPEEVIRYINEVKQEDSRKLY